MQEIELKEAAANPLLGQAHIASSGTFVKRRLPLQTSSPTAASSAHTDLEGFTLRSGSPDLLMSGLDKHQQNSVSQRIIET